MGRTVEEVSDVVAHQPGFDAHIYPRIESLEEFFPVPNA